ncbi:hypothetical protein MBLNU230_g7361t1 [Neophaeotheca triangularis]
MPFFEAPTSFRLRELAGSALSSGSSLHRRDIDHAQAPMSMNSTTNGTLAATMAGAAVHLLQNQLPPHSSHPDFLHLAGLVCEAVLEVVFVALPGFLVAWTGMFDANSQKFVAELNTIVFTPCLIFTKLASQLNADKLADLAVIPVIFVAQTIVSYFCAQLMARVWGFGRKKMQKNFILAMGVFGNSNSLPISLVISLSKTISGLHWDKIPGDNDNEVAARGILYLLIFQQLGQLLRWTWGYSVLLKPKSAYSEDDLRESGELPDEEEGDRYRDDPEPQLNGHSKQANSNGKLIDSDYGSGSQTPGTRSISSASSDEDEGDRPNIIPATPAQGNKVNNEPRNVAKRQSQSSGNEHQDAPSNMGNRSRSTGHITQFPNFNNPSRSSSGEVPRWKQPLYTFRARTLDLLRRIWASISTFASNLFRALPQPIQKTLSTLHHYNVRFWAGVWRQMNPPLWAMLAALVVASIPSLQHLFFSPGTLVNNSVTRAVHQSGGVAVPLILVVLGANLARSTLPSDQLASSPAAKAEERRLLWASIISRMVLPTIIMSPLIAVFAKFVPVSILDDPIFIIVCFLLTGAPSALQLAQICQINGVYMGAMSNLLVASYVVAIFPSTLALVMLALEVVEWAAAG